MSHRDRWFSPLHLQVIGTKRPPPSPIEIARIDNMLRMGRPHSTDCKMFPLGLALVAQAFPRVCHQSPFVLGHPLTWWLTTACSRKTYSRSRFTHIRDLMQVVLAWLFARCLATDEYAYTGRGLHNLEARPKRPPRRYRSDRGRTLPRDQIAAQADELRTNGVVLLAGDDISAGFDRVRAPSDPDRLLEDALSKTAGMPSVA